MYVIDQTADEFQELYNKVKREDRLVYRDLKDPENHLHYMNLAECAGHTLTVSKRCDQSQVIAQEG